MVGVNAPRLIVPYCTVIVHNIVPVRMGWGQKGQYDELSTELLLVSMGEVKYRKIRPRRERAGYYCRSVSLKEVALGIQDCF